MSEATTDLTLSPDEWDVRVVTTALTESGVIPRQEEGEVANKDRMKFDVLLSIDSDAEPNDLIRIAIAGRLRVRGDDHIAFATAIAPLHIADAHSIDLETAEARAAALAKYAGVAVGPLWGVCRNAVLAASAPIAPGLDLPFFPIEFELTPPLEVES